MRILLLSAYDTDSHKSWCQGLLQHCSDIEWTYLVLPGRYFSWRIRGNPLSWAYGEQREMLNKQYDLVMATSMVDLATLKGLVPNLGRIPSVLYMHENQFAYPKSQAQHQSVEPQMVNLYSALAADRIIFNSEFNRTTFLKGAKALLNKMPDCAPLSALETIERKSQILPVPINRPNSFPASKANDTLKVIWNHRWEYDKGPDVLHALIKRCHETHAPLRFTIAGNQFRQTPDSLAQLQSAQYKCVDHIGTFKQRQAYETALTQHQVVLSTACHEFQGLALLEGCAHGCVPLAPNDLAYPEWVPPPCLYDSNSDTLVQANNILQTLMIWQQDGLPERPDVSDYFWENMAQKYTESLFRIQEDYLG